MPSLEEIRAAARLIAPVVAPTPQYAWPLLAKRLGIEVWVKHENHTPTGAFKIRGGLVFIDWLTRTHPEVKGVVAATRGNHGQSVTLAARRAGLESVIVVPHGNSKEKNAAMQAFGAELIVHGEDFQESVEEAGRIAQARGLFAMPSFDLRLVTGVATYSLEFLSALPDLETVYVPIGLGSGICGMLTAKAALGHTVDVVGVVAEEAPAYALSLAQGKLVSHPTTTLIGDGMACRTPAPEALAIIAEGIARTVLVSDAEMEEAMRAYYSDTHSVAEGAGAAALAAAMQDARSGVLEGQQRIGVVLTGQNVDRDIFARVLAG
ncbi:MAG: threonine dehydratase [Rhodospirillaceae bacterium]|nr:threonine dehydratase [Rhodospirillaceae bacterium]MCA8933507.1 threonine dehydratase [Rhodospirillaceae bacterium]